MPIAKLPPLLVNQIAAGEVIDRPNSVVKELLDNAIDAAATRVRIDIEEGGSQLIRVRDDGHGIPPEELPLAVAAHATSKLQHAEDLSAIATLGFRGEALASIASVSRLRLSSLSTFDGKPSDSAACIEQAGDDLTPVAPAAHAPGTVVEIRDLFFNTPARRKFLRAASTEFGHIADTVNRLAMTHPTLGFTLTHNGRTTLDLPPNQTPRARCVAVLGKELDDALMEAHHADPPDAHGQPGPEVWALLGRPEIARATAKFQYLTVNGRPVRDRNLAHAIKEAFRGLIPPDRQPVAVVQINLDPKAVDVNVHPTKAEVRFRDPSRMHGLVLHTLRRCLLAHDLTPEVRFKPQPLTAEPLLKPSAEHSEAPDHPTPPAAPSPTAHLQPNAFVDYFKRMDPTQKGFVYEEVKREMHDTAPDTSPKPWAEERTDEAPEQSLHSSIGVSHSAILQVHNSFVITQDDDGVLIVDQHALHERMMFEQLRSRILDQGKPLESQRLLVPVTLSADAQRQSLLEDLSPLLDALGIEASPMGPSTVAVHAFPSLLFDRKVDPAAFMTDLLDKTQQGDLAPDTLLETPPHNPKPRAEERSDEAPDQVQDQSTPTLPHLNPTALEAALHEVLDMMSCKAAIKAGDKLTDAELAELLLRREQLERASNCPHGRPTTLRLTLKDLERQFGRT